MPYKGDVAASNPGGAVGVTRTAEQAPLDLGGGEGGLPVARQTAVVGESRMKGANLPVDGIEQASTRIERGKVDFAQTAGAETRLNLLDLVGGGGGGGDAAVAADNPDVDQLSTETDPRSQALAAGQPTGLGN